MSGLFLSSQFERGGLTGNGMRKMTRKVMRILAGAILAVVLAPSLTPAAEEWSPWVIHQQHDGIAFRSRQESGGFLSIQWENRCQQPLSWQYKLCYADTWCWEGWVTGIEPGKTTTHGNYHQKSHGRLTEWSLWNVKPYPNGGSVSFPVKETTQE